MAGAYRWAHTGPLLGACVPGPGVPVCGEQSSRRTWRFVVQGRMFSEAAYEPFGSGDRCSPVNSTPHFHSTSIDWAFLWAQRLAKFCPNDAISLRQVTFPLGPQFFHSSNPGQCAWYLKSPPLQTFLCLLPSFPSVSSFLYVPLPLLHTDFYPNSMENLHTSLRQRSQKQTGELRMYMKVTSLGSGTGDWEPSSSIL